MATSLPKIEEVFKDVQLIDKVYSQKTVYYVCESGKNYLVFSFKDSTYVNGFFNVVSGDMVERITRIFGGSKGITAKEINEHPQMKRFAKRFSVLQALYVLVGQKRAKIDGRRKAKRLYFNIYK